MNETGFRISWAQTVDDWVDVIFDQPEPATGEGSGSELVRRSSCHKLKRGVSEIKS